MNAYYYRDVKIVATQILMLLAIIFGLVISVCAEDAAPPAARVLTIKEREFPTESGLTLKDFVMNSHVLTENEKSYQITDAPEKSDTTLSLVDLAYMLQRYPDLMDVRIRGPKNVVVSKFDKPKKVVPQDGKLYLDKARKIIVDYIKNNEPWKGWETDILINSTDEGVITRVGPFERLDVIPYDTKGMVGTVAFRVCFFDKNDRQIDKVIVNPVILRRVEVSVMNVNATQGHIIRKNDMKKVPIWVGGDKKDYIMDEALCIGKELARSLSTGDIIKNNDLLNPVCAKRGDVLWVECRNGPLQVRVAVTALENGRQGDVIKVKNNASKKEFDAELVSEREAVFKI